MTRFESNILSGEGVLKQFGVDNVTAPSPQVRRKNGISQISTY
jgi:hypothetical protein